MNWRMKKTACSYLVLASFLQNITPVCAMGDEESRGGDALPAAAVAEVTRRTYEHLTQDERDCVFETYKAINSPMTTTIASLIENITNLIRDDSFRGEEANTVLMSNIFLQGLSENIEGVKRDLSSFKRMREKYRSQGESQYIWESAERAYASFEEGLEDLSVNLPKVQASDLINIPVSFQEFENFCQASLRFIKNSLTLHRGLTDFPKTSAGFRILVLPDYVGSQSDVEAQGTYFDAWQRLESEFRKLNPTLIETKMVEVNPILRGRAERKPALTEAEAQRQAEETGAARLRTEEARRREIQAEEDQRREAERLLEEARARAAAHRAEQEERRSLLRDEYRGICTTVEAISRIQRTDGSEAYEGIMKFSQKKFGGGEVLLNRLRTLMPRVLELHGLLYENPLEHVRHYPSQACAHLQNEIVTFYEALNTGKHLDLMVPVIESFMSSAQSIPQFETYFAQNRHGGPGFSDLYYRYKKGQLNDAETKEFSKRIIKFGLADEGHSSRLLHPLFLAKRVWDNKPDLRHQTNDILYNFFMMATEQAGRCAAGSTARTNLMLHQLCGLLIDAPIQA